MTGAVYGFGIKFLFLLKLSQFQHNSNVQWVVQNQKKQKERCGAMHEIKKRKRDQP